MACITLDLNNDAEEIVVLTETVTVGIESMTTSLQYVQQFVPPTYLETTSATALDLNVTSVALCFEQSDQAPIYIDLPQPESVTIVLPSVPDIFITQSSSPLTLIIDAQCRTSALTPMPDYNFFSAGENIYAYTVVYMGSNDKVYALTYVDDDYDFLAVRGILLEDVYAGGRGQIQMSGELYRTEWAWISDLPIYVGEYGELTQAVPTTRVFLEVGRALTPRTMFIDLEPPVIIED